MFLEYMWERLSLDLLPTLPVEFGAERLLLLFVFSAVPSYIAYAKTSVERRPIYWFSLLDFALLSSCVFVPVEDFYFDRGTITIFAKTLYALLLLGALLDRDDAKSYPYRRKKFFKKYVVHPLESAAAHAFYLLFKLLPAPMASWLGGRMGRLVGMFRPGYNALIRENLSIAFPRMPAKEKEAVARGMWDMLGRYCAEPAHFQYIYHNRSKYLELKGMEWLDRLSGRPYITFSAHSGSLGLIAVPFALKRTAVSIIYKYPSNNLTNSLVTRSFGRGIGRLSFIPNKKDGTKDAMRVLSKGGVVHATPDQNFQTGIPTRFFGRKVKSPRGVARLAMRFGCPIVPVELERVRGLRHRITIHAPFMPAHTGGKDRDAELTTQAINDVIEGWIRKNPAQWFWVHDRWGVRHRLEKRKQES